MRQDNRPYFIRRIKDAYERWRIRRFLEPQFDSIGPRLTVAYPKGVELWGANIHAGRDLHLHSSRGHVTRLVTWDSGDRKGEIRIGDHVLISPGNEIISSERITIGSNTMIASGCYISDSDWHDTYDRTAEHDKHAAVVLEENVWVGAHAIIGKGVTIGRNSIIGAGSVVVSDIPANVIAAGNPAKPIKPLDPSQGLRTRAALFENADNLQTDIDNLNRYMLRGNTLFGWLRSLIAPRRTD
ncbi:MAG: acyltransferase [Pseudomonadota bacterium]